MENKKFDLSGKILYYGSVSSGRVIQEEDIKKAVQLLKDKLHYNVVEKENFISFTEEAFKRDIEKEIDQIFGDEIVGDERK